MTANGGTNMKPEIGECSITINNVLRLEQEVKQLQSALKMCVEELCFDSADMLALARSHSHDHAITPCKCSNCEKLRRLTPILAATKLLLDKE